MQSISETLLYEISAVLLECQSNNNLVRVTPETEWFEYLLSASTILDHYHIDKHLPFLSNFLIDANEHWQTDQEGSITSGPWIEIYQGQELALEALALNFSGKHFLLIKDLGESYLELSKTLQVARDNLLISEKLEKELVKRNAMLKHREEQIALRLLAAADYRDEETGAHIQRIGLYSKAIATALNLNDDILENIQIAASMHDIGKIAIPDHILLKPGAFEPEELEQMRTHAELGAKMLKGTDIPLLNMAYSIAMNHHEKWDGSGYPNNLQGEEIPIEARIVAIVDVYDAMLSERPYKKPFPEDFVLKHMKENRGSHFDPKVFDTFISILPTIRKIRSDVQ
ncbi:MAG TPA: HD domain-containing protein [Thiomicrospira sp.]|nr:HD domain-containing protein [Thiomicrospira sp.]